MAGSRGTSVAFERALLSFKNKLLPDEVQAFTGSTLEDIRNEASAIQDSQIKKDGVIRGIRRIQPLINGLTQFSGVIGVFVQSKPEVLAFIWGPIKFLLQVTSSYAEAFDELLNAFNTLGENLSRFHVYEKTFLDVPRMQDVIVMIYEDILRFYQATLNFFRGKCWRRLFRSLWNTFNDRFGNILSDLDRHKELVDSEASAVHIAEARAARQAAQKAEETTRAYREKQNLLQIKMWLDPVDYDAFLAKLRSPHSTTGLWFVQENGVQAWLDMADKSKRLLWLTGIPGAGKTFLSASFLRHTQSNYGKNVPIAYAFLRHDSDNTFATIMLTLISQLLHHNLQQLTYFDEIRESKTHPPSSQEEVQEIFKFVLSNIGVSYIFIDGLDEIDTDKRKIVLDTLCHLLTAAENFKIFLSSRHEVDISTSLTDVEKHIHRVDLAGKNQQDIKTYIVEEGEEIFRRFSLDDEMRQQIQDILDEVCDKAEGMFLWARLVIIDLKGQVDFEGLEDAARQLPVGLDAAYGRILNRIKEKLSQNERDLARRVLGWVMCSTRPLSLNELKQAMAIRKGDSCINKRRIILRRLDELCGPVIEIDAEDKIHFVHFTAKEYLTSNYGGRFIRHSEAHQDIAITCIRYLSFSCFDMDTTDDKVKADVLSGEYCLHLYAERNWMYHVKHAIELDHDDSWTKSFASLLAEFVHLRLDEGLPQVANQDVPSEWRFLERLNPSPNVQRHLINYCIFNSGEGLSRGISFDPLTLQKSTQRFRQHLEDIFTFFSMSNHQDQLQSIHRNYGENIFKCSRVQCLHYVNGFDTRNKRDEHLNTHTRPFPCNVQGCDFVSFGFATTRALKAHLQQYHQTHVSDVDTQTRGYSSLGTCPPLGGLDLERLLFDSISTGNVSKVKSVLELDLDLNSGSFNDNGESFLHYALAVGHKDIFQLLLEKGASANTLNMGQTTILNSAISKGSTEYVELLLEWGASVNRLGVWVNWDPEVNDDPAPLIVAVQCSQKESVQLLLEHGADVNSTDGAGVAALLHAVSNSSGSPGITKLLLEQGVSANTVSPDGTPALILAVKHNQKESSQLLLEHGADVNSTNGVGTTALIQAVSSYRESPDIIKILLEQGVSANTVSPNGTPALILAVKYNQKESTRLLLEHGADVDSTDRVGVAALIYAIKLPAHSHSIVKILLEHGVNVNVISARGRPAALEALQRSSPLARQLLEKGEYIDALWKDQRNTAAVRAVEMISNEKLPIMKLLILKYGASPNSKNAEGNPILDIMVLEWESSYSEIAEFLISEGAERDPKFKANSIPSRVGPKIDALLGAIYVGMIELVKRIIKRGVPVNPRDQSRAYSLIAALLTPHYEHEILEMLLKAGADVNHTFGETGSAILHAAERITADSGDDALKLLLTHGARIDMVLNSEKQTALHKMAEKKNTFAARALLEHGARADIPDKEGKTALTIWPELFNQTIHSTGESQSSLQSSVPVPMDEV